MTSPGIPTFDQLRIFLTVAEEGSFAAAGRKLNRATSVISYGIANLEVQLGVTLFDREGTRKPRLTTAGQAVLADARNVAHGVESLRARVQRLLEGVEAEVHLVVDALLPTHLLADALRSFSSEWPTVTLHLHAEALGAVMQMVRDGGAVIGIGGGPIADEHPEIERVFACSVLLVPVAAPAHPLTRQQPIPPGAAREHLQLVLTDRSALTQGRDFSVMAAHTWRLADLSVRHALLREGLGWAYMPLPMVADDLAAGRLLRLAITDSGDVHYDFHAMWRRDTPPGPAAQWLLDRLVENSAAHQNS
ncbi:MAG: LysR family transcriptional regulator [Sphingomonadaceae bacterium]